MAKFASTIDPKTSAHSLVPMNDAAKLLQARWSLRDGKITKADYDKLHNDYKAKVAADEVKERARVVAETKKREEAAEKLYKK